MGEFIIILFVAFLVVLAVGLNWLFAEKKSYRQAQANAVDRQHSQVVATCRQLEQMLFSNWISRAEFDRLRDILDRNYGGRFELPPRTGFVPDENPVENAQTPPVLVPATLVPSPDKPVTEPEPMAISPPAPTEIEPRDRIRDFVTRASQTQSTATTDAKLSPNPNLTSRAPPAAPATPPQPPAASPMTPPVNLVASAPRRSWQEVISLFMQQRNIRWGEIASGILIVGSAVGLVVSLRDELSNRIPYFTALMFLCITGAIHWAGQYSLHKWKLRNTSRGVLIIGLLLVPINLLTATLLAGDLSHRREVNDPVYWLAIAIGALVLTLLTVTAARSLLRRHWWPLAIGVLGPTLAQLWINRGPIQPGTVALNLAIAPAIASFLIAVSCLRPGFWSRGGQSRQTTRRVYLVLAVTAFALITALTLAVVRGGDLSWSLACLSPTIVLAALTSLATVQRIARNHRELSRSGRWIATALSLLVAATGLFGLFVSLINPAIVLAQCGVLAAVFFWQSNRPGLQGLIPLAWSMAAVTLLVAGGFQSGVFAFDKPANGRAYAEMLFTTAAAVRIYCVGLVAFVWHCAVHLRSTDSQKRQVGLATGIGLLLIGSLLGTLTSQVDPNDSLNVHLATLMLAIAALLLAGLSILTSRGVWVHAFSLWSIALGGQFFYVNPIGLRVLHAFAHTLGTPRDPRWSIVAVGVAILAGATAVLARLIDPAPRDGKPRYADNHWLLSTWSIAGVFVSLVGVLSTLSVRPPIASGIAIGEVVAAGCCMMAMRTRAGANILGLTLIVGISVWLNQGLPRNVAHWHEVYGCGLMVGWSLLFSGFCVLAMSFGRRGQKTWLWAGGGRFDQLGLGAVLLMSTVGIAAYLAPGLQMEYLPSLSNTLVNGDFPWDVFAWQIGAIAAVGVALLLANLERPNRWSGMGLALWVVVFGCLWALPMELSRATATAVRWFAGAAALLFAVVSASRTAYRDSWRSLRRGLRLSKPGVLSRRNLQRAIDVNLIAAVALVLGLTTIAIGRGLWKQPFGGPAPDSFFGRLPKDLSYAIPLVLIVAAFLIHGIRERRLVLVLCGSGVFQYLVLAAIFLIGLSPHPVFDTAWFASIVQVSALGMSLYGAVWWVFLHRLEPSTAEPGPANRQLAIHVALNAVLAISLPTAVLLGVAINPASSSELLNAAGGVLGYLAWLGSLALAWAVWRDRPVFLALFFPIALTVFVCLLGASVGAWTQNTLLRFQFIHIGLLMASLAILGSLRLPWVARTADDFTQWHGGFGWTLFIPLTAAVGYSISSWSLFELRPWWTIGTLVAASCLALRFSIVKANSYAAFVATILAMLATHFFCVFDPWSWQRETVAQYWVVQVGAIAIVGTVWALSGIGRDSTRSRGNWYSLDLFSSFVMLVAASFAAGWGFNVSLCKASGWYCDSSLTADRVGWSVAGIVGLLLMASLWDARFRYWSVAFYTWVLGTGLATLGWLSLPNDQTAALASTWIGVWLAATGLIWRWRGPVCVFLQNGAIPRVATLIKHQRSVWLPICLVLAAIALVHSTLLVIASDHLSIRWIATSGVLAAAGGLVPYSTRSTRVIQVAIVALLQCGIVLLAWCCAEGSLLAETPIQLFSLSFLGLSAGATLMTLLHGRRRLADWMRTLSMSVAVSGAVAAGMLACLVSVEWLYQSTQFVLATPGWIRILVAVFSLAAAAGLAFVSVRPAWDPLALNERWRMAYVYLAEFHIALAGGHCAIALPWLFHPVLRMYWPYGLMAIAFLMAAGAELARRRNLAVLEIPLFHTSAAIPILIAIGSVAIDSHTDLALVMVLAGLVYLVNSVTHASLLNLSAALAMGNLALWIYWGRNPGLEWFRHPQLWLIPPAVSVLAATQFHRRQLGPGPIATIRYLASGVIYISSTSEILFRGIGETLWPPMILASLSVIGLLAGILLHIRAFLYFGATFLFVAMVTMVAHANRRFEHVWPWWVFGIVLGAAILILFGLFEKRRHELRQLGRRLSQWDY